jgi:hypothetical protein
MRTNPFSADLTRGKIPFYKADLYTVTLRDRTTIYRWTDFDRTIRLIGTGAIEYDFLAQGPCLQRTQLGVKNTVEVPELTITLAALDTDFVGGQSIKTQLHNGFFDGATIWLDRTLFAQAPVINTGTVSGVFGGNGSDPAGNLFAGRMSTAKITGVGAQLTVKGANVLMNQYVPRNEYQLPCVHNFCDPGCTLAAATFTTTNTAGAGSTRAIVKWGTVPGAPNVYTYGKVTMTSGVAIGQVRTVKFSSAAGLVLQYPFYNTPATGDTYSILKGCDKAFESGSGQSCTDYANTQNYRGFEFIPTADTAI